MNRLRGTGGRAWSVRHAIGMFHVSLFRFEDLEVW